jgi:hypothetical protein
MLVPSGGMLPRPDSCAESLRQAYAIAADVQHLRSLLLLQLSALQSLEDRLYVGAPGTIAARRLAALKRDGEPRAVPAAT